MDKKQAAIQRIETLKRGIMTSNEIYLKYLDELVAIIQEPEQLKSSVIKPPLIVWGNRG